MKRLNLTLFISFFILNTFAQKPTTALLFNTCQHTFSDPARKDIFNLTLTGKTIFTGKVTFEITTAGHKTIFKETFPATDLYGDMDDYFSKKQRQDTIIARFKKFFAASHFLTPAIDKREKYDADYYDKAMFNEIKHNQTIVGFMYSHGYEGTYEIAWSKKQKKVISFFSID